MDAILKEKYRSRREQPEEVVPGQLFNCILYLDAKNIGEFTKKEGGILYEIILLPAVHRDQSRYRATSRGRPE